MELRRYTDPALFQEDSGAFLAAHEAEHNLILGIVATLRAEPGHFAQPPYLALVCDGSEVVAAAVRTPPFNVVVSLGPADAMRLFAGDLRVAFHSLPGVHGPQENAGAFTEAWRAISGAGAHVGIAQRIYRLDTVIPPDGVPGRLRRAEWDDREMLLRWIEGFYSEALGEAGPNDPERAVDSFLRSTSRALYLWQDGDGEAVSMAGYGGPTPRGMRVTAVYTPPEHRRRGYASACVAQVSRLVLETGKEYCFLYTDLSNPTTNHIYQAIGYRPVIDVSEWLFDAPGGGC
jgi:uncharacterized protein